MYVCTYVCTYVCVCVYVRTYVFMNVYVCMYPCKFELLISTKFYCSLVDLNVWLWLGHNICILCKNIVRLKLFDIMSVV